MGERHGLLGRLFASDPNPPPPALLAQAPLNLPLVARPAATPFGAFGEKGEQLGEQIAHVFGRINALQQLRDDFAAIATPMNEFITSHADAQTRLAESEALLARERKETLTLRGVTGTLRTKTSQLEDDIVALQSQLRIHRETADARDADLKSLKLRADDSASRLDWTGRQLAAETEKAQNSADAHRGVADDLQRVEQELALEKARTMEQRDAAIAAEAEIKRLHELVERLQPALGQAKRRIGDLETDLQSSGLSLGALELKIASEQETRQTLEAARAQEKVTFENEIASLVIQVEALTGRQATTARLLEQTRALVTEKIEEMRLADRAAKDALAGKIAAERRHAAADGEVRRLGLQSEAAEKIVQDTQERCAMLGKAMAAKELQLEQTQGRLESLSGQLEATTRRYDQERAEVEAMNRNLIEEVQSEKAERALAQGALSIARASREKLLGQIEELKRVRSLGDHEWREPARRDERDPFEAAEPTNVRVLRAPEVQGEQQP
ncbi:hypothetical protein [Beijerinckia sp. L45]|uniref:hypothetical protein n=1 Tax=Beijerinckia sp. L45 TaxID=1641855 RepID=UPI00131D9328|nr:hypothetical protein [Beijerinckia sp. L45]